MKRSGTLSLGTGEPQEEHTREGCQVPTSSPGLCSLETEACLVMLCPMSKSPSRKREGLQDNAIRKKGSLLLTRVRAPAATNAVVWVREP